MSDKKEKIFWKCSKCGFNVVAPTPPRSLPGVQRAVRV